MILLAINKTTPCFIVWLSSKQKWEETMVSEIYQTKINQIQKSPVTSWKQQFWNITNKNRILSDFIKLKDTYKRKKKIWN